MIFLWEEMMKKGQKYYSSLPYKMIIQKSGKGRSGNEDFVAFYKEYPKIAGIGKNELKAIAELKKHFKAFIEQCLKDGVEIKEPLLKEKKEKVMVLIRQSTLKNIAEKTNNRSKFLDLAANYILERNIILEKD